MKILSPIAETQRLSGNYNAFWLFVIDAAGLALRYSSREITLNSNKYDGLIISFSQLKQEFPQPCGAEEIFSANPFIVKIINQTQNGVDQFAQLYSLGILDNSLCSLYLFLKDPEGISDFSDAIPIQKFRINKVKLTSAEADLELFPEHAISLEQEMLRTLDESFAPNLDKSSIGRPLPIVFGKVFKIPLFPLQTGAKTILSQKLSPEDNILYVESTDNFPQQGKVQIDNEIIEYKDVDKKNNTLGTSSSPLKRNFPIFHSAGAKVYEIPSGGFRYLIADHTCLKISAVWAGERILAADEYIIKQETLKNRTAQTITFPKLPVTSTHLYNDAVMMIDGESFPDNWYLGANNRAVLGENAYDKAGARTCARLTEHHPVLEVVFNANLGDGDKRFGDLLRAKIVIDFTAYPELELWSSITLKIIKGNKELSFLLEKPLYNTQQRIYKYDITSFIAQFGIWKFFSGGSASPKIQVCLKCFNDNVQINIYDICFEINYRGRLTSKIENNITADVEGYHINGQLIENPSDIIKTIIQDSEFLNKTIDDIDEVSFEETKNFLSSNDYIFSKNISSPITYISVLSRLARESRSSLIIENGKFKLLFQNISNLFSAAQFVFDKDIILNFQIPKISSAITETANSFIMRFGIFSEKQPNVLIVKSDASVSHLRMELTKHETLRWHNQTNLKPIKDITNYLLSKSAIQNLTVEIEASFKAIHLERGDIVTLNLETLPQSSINGIVKEIDFIFPDKIKFIILASQVGEKCWEHNAGTFIQHIFNGLKKAFVIDGVCVASIDLAGNMFLKGCVIEQGLSPKYLSSCVQYDEQQKTIDFGFGIAAPFSRVFSIDHFGNLLTGCEISEQYNFNYATINKCISSSSEGLFLSLNNLEPILAFKKTENLIALKSQIIESVNPLESVG